MSGTGQGASPKPMTITEARQLLLASPGWSGTLWFRLDRPWTKEERRVFVDTPRAAARADGEGQ